MAESKCNKGNVSISFFKKEKAIVTAWLSKLPDYVAKRMKYHPSEGKETHQVESEASVEEQNGFKENLIEHVVFTF